MKLKAPWIERRETQTVCALLTRAGHKALFVGGCVRNTILGEPVDDIDIATDAHPETVVALADAADLRAVPTGIDHGTVTLVCGGIPHEVTTFRRDAETDGRRARVVYSGDMAEDAKRRDFTMNAIYAEPDGTVRDPLGGLNDLRARRVRFVGDPAERIAEDYLRILRFFRFHARYGDADAGIDPDGLAACAELSAGIETLSRERIGHEMRKLLAARDPGPSVAAMAATGVLARTLPGADSRILPILLHHDQGLPPRWIRRLAALGGDDVTDRLRLSRDEQRQLTQIRDGAGGTASFAELGYRYGEDIGADAALLRAAMTGAPLAPDWEAELSRGAKASFPVNASDLMPELDGPALGEKLRALEATWLASGLTATRAELLG
ncbi:MAG: CCA tRNA nucleotidyltransferase [Paracoccaceae bacterium]